MTGLMNSASVGDSALAPHLCDPEAAVEPGLTAELRSDSEPGPDPDAWRREVAARLAHYRTRRKPRAPRYPSLLLPFDSYDDRSRSFTATASTAPANSEPASDTFPQEDDTATSSAPFDNGEESRREDEAENRIEYQADVQAGAPPEVSAKIIEFPRSAAIPVMDLIQLADPIFDRPRIVEAPEIVPPAPALGGILMESAQPEPADRPARADSLIFSASIASRLLATSVDALIIVAALSGFSAVFLRFNPIHGPLPLLAGAGGALAIVLWMTYEFFFMVCTGSTPGLYAARLKLANFDGSAVPRRTRRWRVLASFLSAFSAGLGYLWCFLDQDSLCWHDRITRTHLQSASRARSSSIPQ